jgi:hypothetical protein
VRPSVLPTTGLDLTTWAENIIPAVVAFFAQNNVDLPKRRRIVPGQLQLDAWDCEQVSVGVTGINDSGARGQGTTSAAPRSGTPFSAMKVRQVTYGIQIVRCAGSCNQPSFDTNTDDYHEAGLQQLRDMGLLSQVLVNLASSPPDWHPKGAAMDAGQVTPIGPDGNMYAIEGAVTFSALALAAAP